MTTPTAVDQLGALAAGLCQDAGIRVEVGPGGWCWIPAARTIRVDGDDLRTRGPIYCAGVLAHEVGHCFLSRYHLFCVAFPAPAVLAEVLNGIEDPRVNTWIRRRYPGTVAWFAALTEADARRPFRAPLPGVLRFALEAAREELLGWQPAATVHELPPAVAATLDATRVARRRYAETLPSPDLTLPPDLADRYLRLVTPRLADRVPPGRPEGWELAARVSAAEAAIIAGAEILPAARRLLAQDVRHLARFLGRSAGLRSGVRQAVAGDGRGPDLGEVIRAAFAWPAPPRGVALPEHRRLALRALETWLRRCRNRATEGLGRPPLVTDAPSAATSPPPPSPSPSSYDQARARVADQIDRLVRDLEEVLRPQRRLRFRSGFPTGQRLDLRRAMAFAADPRRYDELWQRPTLPQRRDTAFGLLVDLSGSMRGAKIAAALAGTVLLAETLHRLDVAFAVHGFQDVVIPFCRFGDGLTADVRARLGDLPREVEGDRPGGNNRPLHNDDGPCLAEAAAGLLARGAARHVLIVISDGMPEGRRSTPDDLRRTVAELGREPSLTLVGVGLGPGTDHVRTFYPEAVANVPVDQLAAAIGRLLRQNLAGG